MRFTKEFNLSVRCVRCGAKLDCALEDGAEKYDFVVVVDQHNCKAVEQPLAPDVCHVCHVCHGEGVVLENGNLRTCVWC